MDAVKILDGLTIGCASTVDITTVTLEMSRKQGMEFLFSVSKNFQDMRREEGEIRNIIGLGQPFYYRGTWFRVVEDIRR